MNGAQNLPSWVRIMLGTWTDVHVCGVDMGG